MLDSGTLTRPEPVRHQDAVATPLAMPPLLLIAIAAVFYICFFSHLDALGLVGPDEPRYAWVAREMAASGDWVTPRLYGQPWFEKPILYYWSAALAFRALGVNEFTARLPAALAAALATLALGWGALRFYGLSGARLTLLMLPTCIGMFGFARAATPDMLFTAALTAAMVAASSVIWNTPASSRAGPLVLLAFGFFLGGATLAKGPAAIVLAGGSAGVWALVTRRWRAAFRLANPFAIVAFCITALPWYVLCARRNPDFLRVFLLEHNFQRYLTPVFRHEQPFWFYAPILISGLLPWTLLLAGVAHDAVELRRQQRWTSSPGFFFACWAIFPVVFFSFSRSKLPGYVLPAVPPLVLLMARSLGRAIEQKNPSARWLAAGVGLTFIALGVSSSLLLKRLPPASGFVDWHHMLAWIAALVLGGLGVAALGLLRRPAAALLVAVALIAGMIEAANRQTLPQLDAYLSPRHAARAGQAPPGMAVNLAAYRLHRAWRYGLNFYLRRELPEWTPQSPRPGWVYTDSAGLADLARQGVRFAVIERGSPAAMLVHVEP